MSNHLSWDALNDVVDDALSPDARTAVEAHLADCPTCRAQIASLRTLAHRAANAAESIDVPDDAWQVVHDRISDTRRDASGGAGDGVPAVAGHISRIHARRENARRHLLTPPWLVAAALVLVAGSSAVTAVVLRGGSRPTAATGGTSATVRTVSLPPDIQTSERRFLETAAALRAALNEERRHLAPETVATVERSLTVIERAIDEARDALVRDPASTELRDLWARNHQQKLDLLRRAAALVQQT